MLWWWLFPRLQEFGENVHPFIHCLSFFFFFFFFFFFEVEINSRTLIPLFMPESVTVAQQAEMTVGSTIRLTAKVTPVLQKHHIGDSKSYPSFEQKMLKERERKKYIAVTVAALPKQSMSIMF